MYNTYNMKCNEEKAGIAAERIVIRKLLTKSLNKLEAMLKENPKMKERYIISSYVYFRKRDKVSSLKHPLLFENMNNFKAAVKSAKNDDPYFEVFDMCINASEKKENAVEFKKQVADFINKKIEENNFSLRSITEAAEIKYSNAYNFLNKKKYSDISAKNTHKLLWITIAKTEGWTKDDAYKKHKEKFATLEKHWSIDIE